MTKCQTFHLNDPTCNVLESGVMWGDIRHMLVTSAESEIAVLDDITTNNFISVICEGCFEIISRVSFP